MKIIYVHCGEEKLLENCGYINVMHKYNPFTF